ncbi:TIGR03619 family F420-dependent LLM class oxidoreductase [Streptomyces sp. NPDC046909]|uniref:TIGR03619 family F420-dependent LLM class oxidoreductase n=1 Tax=Streptomyces sp. NPDC046909 TaxID=3155617 RepID=UPI0033D55BD6
MRIGVTLGLLHPAVWRDFAVEADALGYESLWVPEHLVFTADMAESAYPGTSSGRPPVDPRAQLFDAPAFLTAIAEATRQIRLGTYVYLFGLRHPFIGARAFLTLDVLSGGRAVVGVGAGWLESEWRAVGLDFASRGRRLDEAVTVARRLWTEQVVEHHGEFYDFEGVHFEPKPVQKPHPPIVAGGESKAALRRAVRLCDGWVSMPHTLESAKPKLDLLHQLLEAEGRDRDSFEITVSAFELSGPDEVEEWEALGVDRLIVRPYTRTTGAVDDLRVFAERYGITASAAQD